MIEQNKICVYAICKNELKFVDAWIESMSEADYVVVLDTGSTDGTFEKLQNDPRITAVVQKVIDPWRFDVARNQSMSLIPQDTTVCVCTDLDELFEPGWAQTLRDNWDCDKHTQCLYKYAWSHDEYGNPTRIFTYDKIHSLRGWHWKFPVHEELDCDDTVDRLKVLDLFDNLYLHHYQDINKSRTSYLSLVELRKQENPEDFVTRTHVVHEYFYNGLYRKCIDEVDSVIETFRSDISTDIITSLLLFKGDSYVQLQEDQSAINTYQEAIYVNNTYVEPYIALAQVLVKYDKCNEIIEILNDCRKNAKQYFVWFRWAFANGDDTLYNILACAYACVGDYDNAFINISKAQHLSPDDETITSNYNFIVSHFYDNIWPLTNNSIVR